MGLQFSREVTPPEEVKNSESKMPDRLENATVLGGGSFGTALATLFSSVGQNVIIWMRNKDTAEYINKFHENPRYVKGYEIPEKVIATTDMLGAIEKADWIVLSVPSHVLRQNVEKIKEVWEKRPVPLLLACKGLEGETLMTMDEVVVDVLGPEAERWVCALSGPSFAKEMMQGMITAVTIAGVNSELCRLMCKTLFSQRFRPYYTRDIIGVEIGGALKNVIAIASGICIGMEMGVNCRTMLITRGLQEITKMAVAKGANPLTLAGLAGVGDLMLTCNASMSRNNRVGQALGRGKTVDEACEEIGEVAEGIRTTKCAYELMKKLDLDLPIITGVYDILYSDLTVKDVLTRVLQKPTGKETQFSFISAEYAKLPVLLLQESNEHSLGPMEEEKDVVISDVV